MIELAQERLKRTAPEGSGPATGSADRVAGKEPGDGPERREGGTTERSRESRAVPPGEARAIVNTIHALTKKASEAKEGKAEADGWGAQCMSALYRGRLEALSWAVQELLWALPEPDSEAGIDLTPFYDLPAAFIPRGRESPKDKRSGRRNAPSVEPGGALKERKP